MAQDQALVDVGSGGWTQLTNADVTAISFQVVQGAVYVRFTTDTTEPSATAKGWLYLEGNGELNKNISDLTKLSGADRVWARGAFSDDAQVQVDHA